MPDAYDNFRGTGTLPLIPWLQVFEPGQRVRITATQQLGTVTAQHHGVVDVGLDDQPYTRPFSPGDLRPA